MSAKAQAIFCVFSNAVTERGEVIHICRRLGFVERLYLDGQPYAPQAEAFDKTFCWLSGFLLGVLAVLVLT